MSFSENLSRLQEKSKETNYRLAKEIGVHQSTISNWKTGVMPHPKHMRLVAEHFGVAVDDLLKSDDDA